MTDLSTNTITAVRTNLMSSLRTSLIPPCEHIHLLMTTSSLCSSPIGSSELQTERERKSEARLMTTLG